jgi:hypothetical protein
VRETKRGGVFHPKVIFMWLEQNRTEKKESGECGGCLSFERLESCQKIS